MKTVSIDELQTGELFIEDNKMCLVLQRRQMTSPYGAPGTRIDYLKGENFYTVFTPSKSKNTTQRVD